MLSKIVENRQKSKFCNLEKGVLDLHQAATIKPRKIERSVPEKSQFSDREGQKESYFSKIVIYLFPFLFSALFLESLKDKLLSALLHSVPVWQIFGLENWN